MRQEEHDHVSIFVGTWNMGDAGPPAEISSWIRCNGMGKTLSTKLEHAHDMYVFGTQVRKRLQETVGSLAHLGVRYLNPQKYTIFDPLIIILTTPLHVPHTCHATPPPLQETSVSEKDWFSILKQTLKTLYSIDYEKVTSQTLWGIRCLILVKSEHSNKISHVQVHSMGQLCLQFCMLLFSQIVGFTICSVMYEIILLLDNNSIIIHIHVVIIYGNLCCAGVSGAYWYWQCLGQQRRSWHLLLFWKYLPLLH